MTTTLIRNFLPKISAAPTSHHDSKEAETVMGKDINGNNQKLEKTKPYQMTLFQYFLEDGFKEKKEYSNSIELYDIVPKYFTSSPALTALRHNSEFGSYLPTIERKFCYRGKHYSVEITPGFTKRPLKPGIMFTTHRYPMEREQLVEEALRKLACNNEGGVYLDNKAGVVFNLWHVQKELKSHGHTINYPELVEALTICHTSSIAIKSADGKKLVSSSLFPVLLFSTRTDWLQDPKNAKFYVQFNPLVTDSISSLSYRQFNYGLFMKLRSPLARWLYKRLSHHFINADASTTYGIRASTIINDSSLVNCNEFRHSLRQINSALDELKKNYVVDKYTLERKYDGKKIVDVKYDLSMAYLNFISPAIIANKRRKEIIARARHDNKLHEDYSQDDILFTVTG